MELHLAWGKQVYYTLIKIFRRKVDEIKLKLQMVHLDNSAECKIHLFASNQL